MIADALENLVNYQQVIPHSKEILNYLAAKDISFLDAGKYQVLGESAFILIQDYLTKPETEKRWESHKKYIDIQIVLKGKEFMGYSHANLLKIKEAYSEEKDIMFYENDSEEHCMLSVPHNCFCLFYPEEAHKPGIHVSKESAIKKAVIKVLAR
jgi:YhcH/YjgK/YiaL family protein